MREFAAPLQYKQAFFDFLHHCTVIELHGLDLEWLELRFPVQALELLLL